MVLQKTYSLMVYATERAQCPFEEWLDTLEETTRRTMLSRLSRIELGNLGSVRNLGGGVSELKIDSGPGCRIYISLRGTTILVLCAGTKRHQARDIKKAREYLDDFEKNHKA